MLCLKQTQTKQIAPLSGAICGEMGTELRFEQRKKSSRFSTRFRCERRGSKWQTALPPAAASDKPHCRSRQQAQAMAHRKQIAPLSGAICGEMGRKYCFEQRKKSSRCPTRFRSERRGSKRKRWHTASKLRRCPVQFAGRWEESIASNKERNRVASRLDFDVKGAAASGYRA